MTFYTDPPQISHHFQESGLDTFSTGIAAGTAFEESFDNIPVNDLLHANALSLSRAGPRIGRFGTPNPYYSKMLSAEEANERFGIPDELKFDKPTREREAELLNKWKTETIQRQDVLRRSSQSLAAKTTRVGASFLANALDPINVATAFVPVIGQARFGYLAARLGKVGATAVKGAAEGAVGATLVEPLHYFESKQEQEDYTGLDSLTNIIFGTVLGGGLHLGVGAIKERFGGKAKADPSAPADTGKSELSPLQRDIDQLPAESRHALLSGAVADIAEGRRVDIADALEFERQRLGKAYDQVRVSPTGPADDPLVLVRPEDIDAVAVERGGFKEINELEINKNYGLVKFIWKHGEESGKPPKFQVTREDIVSFSNITRDYAPVERTDANGQLTRTWRVSLTDADQQAKTLVYVDKTFDGESNPRHLVSVHVEEPGREAGAFSEKRGAPDSYGGFRSPAEDTDGALGREVSQESGAGGDIPENVSENNLQSALRRRAEPEPPTPEQAAIEAMALKEDSDAVALREENALYDERLKSVGKEDLKEIKEVDTEIARIEAKAKAREQLGLCFLGG
jgi:hypothetical protein